MDNQVAIQQKEKSRTTRLLTIIATGSIAIFFGSLCSAYLFRRQAPDWFHTTLPHFFIISTILVILSSISLTIAQWALKVEKIKLSYYYATGAMITGILFLFSQTFAWYQMYQNGNYFVGSYSSPSASFIFVLSFAHFCHIISGIIVLAYITTKLKKGGYSNSNNYGFNTGSIYWHFLTILWIYLFLFMNYI